MKFREEKDELWVEDGGGDEKKKDRWVEDGGGKKEEESGRVEIKEDER